MATIANATGFEIPDIQAYGSAGAGTPTIAATHARHGTYALNCARTNNPCYLAFNNANNNFTWTGGTRTAFRIGLYITTLPASGTINLFSGSNFKLQITSAGVIGAAIGSGSVQTGPTLATGQYYVLEFEVDTATGGAWVLRWKVDNTAQTNATATNAGTASVNSFNIGSTDSGVTFDFWYDDLALSTTAGDYPLGNGYGVGYKVSASGTHSITIGVFQDDGANLILAGETTSYTKLTETTPDSTTYVKQTAAAGTNYLEYLLADTGSPTDTPQFVRTAIYEANNSSTFPSGNVKLHDSSTDTSLPQPGAFTSAMVYREIRQAVRAGGQGAWTTAAIDALTMRVGYASLIDGSDAPPRLSYAQIEVDYSTSYTVTTNLSVDGSDTPTGALTLQTTTTLAGSDTPIGHLTLATSETLAGSVTPTGALAAHAVTTTPEAFSGSVTPTGALTLEVVETFAVSGSVTPTGALVVNVVAHLFLSGSVTPTATGLTTSPAETVIVCTPLRQVLGCGTYQVYVLTRGAQEIILEVPWTTLDWSRVLDDTSDASVTVAGAFATGENRCKSLAGVYPWEHELALYRDTYRVWSGPITRLENPGGGVVVLKASDLSKWLDERVLHHDHDYPAPGSDVSLIFRDYVEDAMAADNTPGLGVSVQPTGVAGVRTVKAAEYQVAGAAIRELARTGIDWTMQDRVMYAGGQTVPQSQVLTLLDPHLAQRPTVIRDGLAQQNRIVVAGAGIGTDGPSVIGEASDPASEALAGLLEGYVSESQIADVPSADVAAQTRLALLSDVPTILESVALDQTAPFTQDTLIAGILVDVRLTETDLGPVIDRYRIASIKATADSTGAETITVTFQPKGTL